MISVYKSTSYREIIRKMVLSKKKIDKTFNFQKMSESTGIPKSYLSRVISGKADLNSDQLYLVVEFLNLEPEQYQYLCLLLEYERCSLRKRKSQLKKQVLDIQKQHLRSELELKNKRVVSSPENLRQYYLNPILQIIHVSLSIHYFRKNLDELRNSLGLTKSQFTLHLNQLEKLSLIEVSEQGYVVSDTGIHLPESSSIYKTWRALVRQLSIGRMQSNLDSSDYAFSVFFTADPATRNKIRAEFLSFLKKVESLAAGSQSKNLYQINFDLLTWLSVEN